jgi:DNA-binding response OmpR family regulator
MARIGLLEDNIRIARLCATMLHYAGHEVVIYADPQECLCALAPPGMRPPLQSFLDRGWEEIAVLPIDVLILDLHLPIMSGLEVLRLLKSCPRTCGLPLIFCTAATTSEIDGAFALAPNAALVEKPFKLQALVSAITRVLRSSMQGA